jgi:uncharacterized protein YkwD
MARRPGSALAVLIAVLACAATLLPVPAGASSKVQVSTLDLGVLTQLNRIRSEHGLVPLAESPALDAAALQHTREMVAMGYFAHSSSNGTPFWQRIRAYYPQANDEYWSVGENLFWTSGPATATEGMRAWMASPDHRANILDPSWRQIGIASVSAPHAPGAFQGLDVTVITTDFGVRRG